MAKGRSWNLQQQVKSIPAGQPVVYKLFGPANDLWYIGMSINLRQRLYCHNWPWISDVRTVIALPFESREAAAVAEKQMIQSLRPRFNRDFNGRHGAPLDPMERSTCLEKAGTVLAMSGNPD